MLLTEVNLADDDDPDAEYHRLVLRQLTDHGITISDALSRAAEAVAVASFNGDATAAKDLPEIGAAYDRVARAVRRTVFLARRLATVAPTRTRDRTAARRRLIRDVEDAIDRQVVDAADRQRANAPTAEHAADLSAELAERLDDPALDDDLATRPVPEIVADICRDLGLAAPAAARSDYGRRRTPADIRDLCRRAATRSPGPAPEPDPEPDPQPAFGPDPNTLALGAAHVLLRTADP